MVLLLKIYNRQLTFFFPQTEYKKAKGKIHDDRESFLDPKKLR